VIRRQEKSRSLALLGMTMEKGLEGGGDKRTERSLHPGDAHGAGKSRFAARRAIRRRGRKNRAASVGMTEGNEGKRDPRTGLKTGHYKGEEKSGPPPRPGRGKRQGGPYKGGRKPPRGRGWKRRGSEWRRFDTTVR